MNILAIGNSFSQDATRYLHGIARAAGVHIDVANLYIGGCPLDRHFRNMHSEERCYELEYNGELTHFKVSLKEALLNRAWDAITLQQSSPKSFTYDTYVPYLNELADYIRKLCPNAKLVIHETWAYEKDSERLFKVAKLETPELMINGIIEANERAAKEINAFGIIRSGELIYALTNENIGLLHRDTFHLSKGLGRYAAGLLWFAFFTGKDVTENTFSDLDEPISDEAFKTVKKLIKDYI